MAPALLDRPALRPTCPKHPGTRILLDGFTGARWSDAHRRPRYRCVPVPGAKGHSFTLPVAIRQPTDAHPDAGRACPNCEHVLERHEGVRTGRGFVFGHQEIARLLIKIGEGSSLREASIELRQHVLEDEQPQAGRAPVQADPAWRREPASEPRRELPRRICDRRPRGAAAASMAAGPDPRLDHAHGDRLSVTQCG